MGAHLLTLSELCPALLHLASEKCIAQLAQTYLGRSLARNIGSLADEVHSLLGAPIEHEARPNPDDSGDLALYPGYAVMAVEHLGSEDREVGVQLWSRLDPLSSPPAQIIEVGDEPEESPAHAALKAQTVALINDLRQGLRIEARYRALPLNLDAQLFGPLDAAVRRRWDRVARAAGREWGYLGLPAAELRGGRHEEPSVGAGPAGL